MDAGDEITRPRPSRRSRAAVTIADVAREAGVSLMTVSRVMNGKSNVASKTRSRVQAAIEALNYSPSAAARNLAAAKEIRLALLYSNPSPGYLNEFLFGCLDQARRSNVQLVVELCGEGPGRAETARRLIESGVDGLILPPPLCDDKDIQKLLAGAGVPGVAVGSGAPPSFLSSVRIGDRAAAAAMTRHLIEHGHRRIGFIRGNPNQSASGRRLCGFRDALAEAAIVSDPLLIVDGQFSYKSGLQAAQELLALPEPPSAIFASNDDMAAATIAVAHRLGLAVPGALSVVGFDDAPQAVMTWPELTTIRQPIAEMSRAAVELLVEDVRNRLEKKHFPARHIKMPFELIERDSVAGPVSSAQAGTGLEIVRAG